MKKIRLPFLCAFSVACLLVSCSSKDDPKVKQLNNEGIEFLDQQNYSSALIKFQEALQLEQSDESKSQLYRNLATVYFNMDQPDSSVLYSKKAYESAEKDSYAYYLNKAEYDLMTNKVTEAIQLLEKAMALEPKKMEAYSNLSLIYNGNYGDEFIDLSKALKFARKAYVLNPSPSNEEQLAAVYFQMDDFEKSTEHYLALMKKYPEVKIYQLYAGNSMYSQGKWEEGVALMKEAAARDENCRELFDELMSENVD